MEIKQIAHIESEFSQKFGIPRQSGMVPTLTSRVVFEKPYRNPDALKGLEGYSHIWLIWEFSEAVREEWSPTVRPPRLGGNVRRGVFSTRSPFRPNPIGLSLVKLEEIVMDEQVGPCLVVGGADLMDQTPIYDIKPYLPQFESHPEALGGFSANVADYRLSVTMADTWDALMTPQQKESIIGILSLGPRPSYQQDPDRVYGMSFAGLEVRFRVDGEQLTVTEVVGGSEET